MLFMMSVGLGSTFAGRHAVLVQPLGPTAGWVASALKFPSYEVNLRVHNTFTGAVGWTTSVEMLSAWALLARPAHAGLRTGPRFSLRQRGLSDWTVHTFVLGGGSWLAAPDSGVLAHWAVLGTGAEIGRTWVWNRFVFELGTGLYVSTNTAYIARADGLKGSRPKTIFPVKPMLTLGLGYAF